MKYYLCFSFPIDIYWVATVYIFIYNIIPIIVSMYFTYTCSNWFQLYQYCVIQYHGTVTYKSVMESIFTNNSHSSYIAIIFLWRFHERHPIAHPSGRVMGCRSWMQSLAKVVSLHSFCVYYRVIEDCDISRVYSIEYKSVHISVLQNCAQ